MKAIWLGLAKLVPVSDLTKPTFGLGDLSANYLDIAMWTQSVPFGHLEEAEAQRLPERPSAAQWTQEELPSSTMDSAPGLSCGLLGDSTSPFSYYRDQMLTRSGLAEHDNLYSPTGPGAYSQTPNTGFGAMYQFVAPGQTLSNVPTSTSTPPLTVASSPTLDGGRSAIDSIAPSRSQTFSIWPSDWSAAESLPMLRVPSAQSHLPGPALAHSDCPVHSRFVPTPTSVTQVQEPRSIHSDRGSEIESKSTGNQPVKLEEVRSPTEASETTTSLDNGHGRKGKLYEVKPHQDGFYYCPYRAQNKCAHEKTKLKCNYDKYIDSHLKPYRCSAVGCEDQRFSSTACRLRHEREAHGSHGHGVKPFLCDYPDCDRSKPGNGFPRSWNRNDHMKRVHDHNVEKSGASPKHTDLGGLSTGSGSRKRSAADETAGEPEKRRKMAPTLPDYPAGLSQPSSVLAQSSPVTPQQMFLMQQEQLRQCQDRLAFYSPQLDIGNSHDGDLLNQANMDMMAMIYPNSLPHT